MFEAAVGLFIAGKMCTVLTVKYSVPLKRQPFQVSDRERLAQLGPTPCWKRTGCVGLPLRVRSAGAERYEHHHLHRRSVLDRIHQRE